MLCSLLLLGKLIVYFAQRSYIPPSVIGGFIGLICLTIVGMIDVQFNTDIKLGLELMKKNLVNFVFAALILGLSCSRASSRHWTTRGIITSILHEGMPMVIYNQILTWGQSTICVFLMCFYNLFDKSIPPLFAAMVPLGLEAGLEINPTRFFRHFWSPTIVEEAESLGLMCAVFMATIFILYKSYFLKRLGEPTNESFNQNPLQMEAFDRHFEGRHKEMLKSVSANNLELMVSSKAMEKHLEDKAPKVRDDASLGIHISLIAISVFLAFGIKFSTKIMEIHLSLDQFGVLGGVRLFKLSMCCALVCMQVALRYSNVNFKREWFMRLCGLSLDIIVIAVSC